MNTGFHYELAKDHGAKLQREAQYARFARAARERRGPASTPKPKRLRAWLFAAAAATSLGVTGAAYASASGGASGAPMTPNDCIRINGGDFNACNVGNSGRGDLPYRPVAVDGHRVQSHPDCRPSPVEHNC